MPRDATLVLVVEDEPLVRMAAVDVIEEAGYPVIEARDADEAIRLLEANPAVAIVFTDIQMPGSMDGAKLALCIRDRWPPIEIIVTSGHVHPANVVLPERGVFLPKPYLPGELLARIGAMAGA